jgi:peptidoglycan/xylan/chitin deacetylase (PgdA/CDA1 family)
VTVYVATGQIESGRAYWFDRVMSALQGAGPVTLDLGEAPPRTWTLPAEGDKARWTVMSDILETLKSLPPDRREALADRIASERPAPAPESVLAPMTRAELAELAASPWVTIGAHSHCHNLLDQIASEAARHSVARSRALLQDWTGQPVWHFAYPNGNHTPALGKTVADLGFRSATVLGEKLAHGDADRFALPRLAIGRYDDLTRFRLRLVGL